MQAEDLVAAVFPDQIACAENLVGEREIPDHPLTNQTIWDCLHEAMDIDGLERLLRRMESGDVRVVACDLTQPSPLALEVLSARPYAFLDDAPLEERRAQAVMARRWQDPQSASDLGRLDPEAIARVKGEAWPDPIDAEELHDALLWIGCLTEAEVAAAPEWAGWLEALARDKRATRLETGEATLWVAAERLDAISCAVWPKARLAPKIAPPRRRGAGVWSAETGADRNFARAARGSRPGDADGSCRARSASSRRAVAAALAALEAEGTIMRGRFLPGANDEQWCDRRLLARIHHYTIKRLRAEIEPVAARDFLRFLLRLAACRRGGAARRAGGARRRARRSRGFRGAGGRLGDGNPAGAALRLRAVLSRSLSASPAASPGRG